MEIGDRWVDEMFITADSYVPQHVPTQVDLGQFKCQTDLAHVSSIAMCHLQAPINPHMKMVLDLVQRTGATLTSAGSVFLIYINYSSRFGPPTVQQTTLISGPDNGTIVARDPKIRVQSLIQRQVNKEGTWRLVFSSIIMSQYGE